ncbi:MAG: nicotinamide riboside transporter PnuC [Saprospiraceae bacterium]
MNAQVIEYIEWIAAAFGLVNVFLLTRQTLWAWPAGLTSVFLYAFVFYHSKLYSDVMLHTIYVVLNAFGWYKWSSKNSTQTEALSVSTLRNSERFFWLLAILVGFVIWGYFLHKNTDASFAFADAFILMASLCAQYLLAIKKLENWVIWIIVDVVAISIYYLKELYVTSVLYAVYLLICILGYVEWKKSLKLIRQ